MAAKKEAPVKYNEITRELRDNGPERLYLLWGEEDYLKDLYIQELNKICLPEGANEFCYHVFSNEELDFIELRDSIESFPFMSERSLVVVKDLDLNRLKEEEQKILLDIFEDIPEYCTVLFDQSVSFTPDGRLKIIKAIKKHGREIHFNVQPENDMVNWVQRRFKALNKGISRSDAERLIFMSGKLMNRLIPEIEKIASYCKTDTISRSDIDAVATHVPEAEVFEISDCIANRNTDQAMKILSELLGNKENSPIALLAIVGNQMRRLYVAKLAQEKRLGRKYIEDVCDIHYSFIVDKLLNSASRFTLPQLKRSVQLCCESDYLMKASAIDDEDILRDLLLRISAGEE